MNEEILLFSDIGDAVEQEIVDKDEEDEEEKDKKATDGDEAEEEEKEEVLM